MTFFYTEDDRQAVIFLLKSANYDNVNMIFKSGQVVSFSGEAETEIVSLSTSSLFMALYDIMQSGYFQLFRILLICSLNVSESRISLMNSTDHTFESPVFSSNITRGRPV